MVLNGECEVCILDMDHKRAIATEVVLVYIVIIQQFTKGYLFRLTSCLRHWLVTLTGVKKNRTNAKLIARTKVDVDIVNNNNVFLLRHKIISNQSNIF